MKVVYIGPHQAVTVDRSRAERNGDPVEVDDETGKALVARGDFERAGGSRKASKADDNAGGAQQTEKE
jgi:hypothetical protein